VALIGLVSDSHGEWLRTREAMKLLCSKKCERILHMGDIETHEVLDELAGNNVSLVFGNCDYVSHLESYARSLDLDIQHPAGVCEVDGIRIGFLHGHDEAQFHRFIDDEAISVVVHGHTHTKRDEMLAATRCINPGALHRAPVYTVAVLDTEEGTVTFYELE
jgi:putative phosphoesterase